MDSLSALEFLVSVGWLSSEELSAFGTALNLTCKWFVLSYTMATTCLFISALSIMLAIAIHADRELD